MLMNYQPDKLNQILVTIETFKKDFYNRFQLHPKVLWSYGKENTESKLDLRTLEEAANTLLETLPRHDSIRTRSRKKEVVMLRQCIFKLARESGYTVTIIGTYFGFDHSTVTYSVKHVENLLKTKDKLTINTLKKLDDVIKKQFRNDGDVQHDVEEGGNS